MSVTDTGGTTSDPVAEPDTSQDKPALSVTRRNFLIGAGAGAAAAGVVLGGAVVANKALNPETATTTTTTGVGPVAATMRRVSLNIDNVKYDLIVDNRESLWETMNFQLGLSNSNLGCDRAQCGACAVLVDGKAVNGCTVLSSRLGRGQVIGTVAGLPKGPGVSGLHPVQRAFWLDGGFQCGICTRGFIMSTVQLLGANPKPNTAQIAEALSGNICRCGEYAKIFTSVNVAAAELRGEQVSHLATPVLVGASGSKEAAPGAAGTSKEFTFERAMGTIEDFEPFERQLRARDGILAVSGSERSVTIKWDPAKLDEAKVRQIVRELNFPVR